MLTRLDHVGIVARSWEECEANFTGMLGFPIEGSRTPMPEGSYMAAENVRIYFFRVGVGETLIEVLVPLDAVSGTAKFLAKRGPGMHHLCYSSDDLAEDSRILRERGYAQIDLTHGRTDLKKEAEGAAFYYPRSAMGILTEVIPDTPTPWTNPG